MYSAQAVIFLILLRLSGLFAQSTAYCKDICDACERCKVCMSESLSCDDKLMSRLPKQIRHTVTTFIIINPVFSQRDLSSENFTSISHPKVSLIYLTIRNSNIRLVRPRTFTSMTSLRYLDISSTTNLSILSQAFFGLQLTLLKLDHNSHLQLDIGAFEGLSVVSLHMSNSDLIDLPFKLLQPILSSLKNLFLTNNKIKIFDPMMQNSFKNLEKLELHKNLFSCICKMKWLTEVFIYRKKMNKLSKDTFGDLQDLSPVCDSPHYLKGMYIHNISLSAFNCEPPALIQMKIDFQSPTESRLTCVARNRIPSAPIKVSWLEDITGNLQDVTSNLLNRFAVRESMSASISETVKVSRKRPIDSFKCIAKNINGNVTATVRISWPVIQNPKFSSTTVSESGNGFPQSTITNWSESAPNSDNYLFKKRFTLLEMLGAVIGTFSLTLLLFFVLYKFLHLRRKLQRKTLVPPNGYTTYDAAVYSDSQTYDVPGNSYPQSVLLPMPHLSNSNPEHFLDFKTQKKLYNPASN